MTGIENSETVPDVTAGVTDLWYTRTPEQESMQAAAHGFVQHCAPVERLLVRGDGGPGSDDSSLWKLLHEQLGGQAILIPEEYGGMGFGIEELCVLLEEAGSQLAFPSLFPTFAQAVPLLLLSDDGQAKQTWLSRVAVGNCRATVAYLNDRGQARSPEYGPSVAGCGGSSTGRPRWCSTQRSATSCSCWP